MALYVCILLKKSTVLAALDIEAPDHDAAIAQVLKRAKDHPGCTKIEVWTGGQKMLTYTGPMLAS